MQKIQLVSAHLDITNLSPSEKDPVLIQPSQVLSAPQTFTIVSPHVLLRIAEEKGVCSSDVEPSSPSSSSRNKILWRSPKRDQDIGEQTSSLEVVVCGLVELCWFPSSPPVSRLDGFYSSEIRSGEKTSEMYYRRRKAQADWEWGRRPDGALRQTSGWPGRTWRHSTHR